MVADRNIAQDDCIKATEIVIAQKRFIHDGRSKLTEDQKMDVYTKVFPVVKQYCQSWPSQTSRITQLVIEFLWSGLPTKRMLSSPDQFSSDDIFSSISYLSADDKWLVADSFSYKDNQHTNHYLSLWNIASGECHWKFAAHTQYIKELIVTSDNQYIISASWDCSIKIWSLSTSELIHTLWHHDWVISCSLSADNQFLASTSHDQTTCVWSVQTGTRIKVLHHVNMIYWTQFCANDQHLITAGMTMRVWDIQSESCLQILLDGHLDWIITCTLSDDELLLLSMGFYDTIKVWDMVKAQCIQTFQPTRPRESGCFVNQNTCVAAIDNDRRLCIWRISDGQCIQQVPNIERINSLRSYWLRNEDKECIIVSTKYYFDAQVLAVESGEIIYTTEDFHGTWKVSLSSNGRYLISAGVAQTIRIWVFSENKPKLLI